MNMTLFLQFINIYYISVLFVLFFFFYIKSFKHQTSKKNLRFKNTSMMEIHLIRPILRLKE